MKPFGGPIRDQHGHDLPEDPAQYLRRESHLHA